MSPRNGKEMVRKAKAISKLKEKGLSPLEIAALVANESRGSIYQLLSAAKLSSAILEEWEADKLTFSVIRTISALKPKYIGKVMEELRALPGYHEGKCSDRALLDTVKIALLRRAPVISKPAPAPLKVITPIPEPLRNPSAAEPAPQLLTREMAAKQLSVGLRTIDRSILKGDLKYVRIGRSIRIYQSELNRFCQARETQINPNR